MTLRFFSLVFAGILGWMVVHGAALALHVPLKRMIFDGVGQEQTLTVINDTSEKQDYAVDWLYYSMQENGSLKKLEGRADVPGLRWADELVRMEPTHFTLAPGAVQEVRFSLKKNTDLADGEYRAHFRVRTEGGDAAQKGKAGVMQLAIDGGLVMPLFVRRGNVDGNVGIKNVEIVRPARSGELAKVRMVLVRQGNKSMYGDVTVFCLGDGGIEKQIRKVSGIAVYTEVPERHMSFNAEFPAEAMQDCPRIQARFSPMRDGRPDGAATLSEAVSFASTEPRNGKK